VYCERAEGGFLGVGGGERMPSARMLLQAKAWPRGAGARNPTTQVPRLSSDEGLNAVGGGKRGREIDAAGGR
jgi:hypothetical protein